jgi:hypothetical protein
MTTETPQWALDKAAKAAGYIDYETVSRMCMAGSVIRDSIEAHAATLAKYETEPVDPVLVKAREMYAQKYELGAAKDNILNGGLDTNPVIECLMEALRLPAMGDSNDH